MQSRLISGGDGYFRSGAFNRSHARHTYCLLLMANYLLLITSCQLPVTNDVVP